MSEENREWLSKVMDSLVVDEVKRMKIINEVLQWPEDAATLRSNLATTQELQLMRPMKEEGRTKDPRELKTEEKFAIPDDDSALVEALVAKKVDALEELDEHVLSIDKSIDFYKVGGFPHLLAQMQSSHASLRALAAHAFSTIVQNNPETQNYALELDIFASIKGLLMDKTPNVVAKGLLLLSSLIRQNDKASLLFIHQGGVELVAVCLATTCSSDRAQAKAIRLLRYLITYKKGIGKGVTTDRLLTREPLALLLSFVGHASVDVRENCVGLLADMLKTSPSSKTALLVPALCASKVLASRLKELRAIKEIEEKDVVADELDNLNALLQLLLSKAPERDEEYEAVKKAREDEGRARREAEATARRELAQREGEQRKIEEDRRKELGKKQLEEKKTKLALLQHQKDDTSV